MRGFVDKIILFQYPEIMIFMPRKDFIPNMETQLFVSSAHPTRPQQFYSQIYGHKK